MRALYSLKGTVNKSKLSFRSLTTLFDSLIKPIALYGAPIYTPDMHIIKHIAKLSRDSAHLSHTQFLRKLSHLDCEKTHLHFLKWALGVNRKASNIGVWGESGRYPLIYECLNLTIKYLRRLKNLKNDSLVSLAFREQAKMNLDWYSGIEPLLSLDPTFEMDHVTAHQFMKSKGTNKYNNHQPPTQNDFLFHKGIKQRIPQQSVINPNQCKNFSPFIIMKRLKQNFKQSWQSGLNSSTKLETYCTLKSEFVKEPYLDIVKTYTDRVSLTRLRISAHNLEIEMGRRTNTPRIARICKWCNLSLGAETTENETHLINDCDLYAQFRRNLILKLKHLHTEFSSRTATSINDILSCTTSKPELISSPKYDNQCHQLRLIARFVNRCFSVRANFLTSCTLSKPSSSTDR